MRQRELGENSPATLPQDTPPHPLQRCFVITVSLSTHLSSQSESGSNAGNHLEPRELGFVALLWPEKDTSAETAVGTGEPIYVCPAGQQNMGTGF